MTGKERDIDAWVEALAGRGVRETPDDPEIAAIRAVLRTEAQVPIGRESLPDATAADPRLDALMERLRREGLLDDSPADGRPVRFPGRRPKPTWIGWTGGLAVAATLVLALTIPAFVGGPDTPALVPYQSDNFDDAPRLRSGPGDRHGITADPSQIGRLIPRLQAHRLPYRLRETEGAWRLDFYVPDAARAGASEWLSPESIPIPPTGWVRLETAKASR